jgi:hypothetical protein
MASVGTFLAGVAAFLALWIPSAIPAAPAQVAPTTEPAAGIATLSQVTDLIRDRAAPLLPMASTPYDGWVDVASIPFQTRVPEAWDAQEFADWLDDSDNYLGTAVLASTSSVEDLYDESAVAGVWVSGTAATLEPSELHASRLDKRQALCNESEEFPFSTPAYTGTAVLWTSCGDDPLAIADFHANHNETGATVVVFAKAITVDDIEAFGDVVTGLSYDDTADENRLGNGRVSPGKSRPDMDEY